MNRIDKLLLSRSYESSGDGRQREREREGQEGKGRKRTYLEEEITGERTENGEKLVLEATGVGEEEA